MPTHPRLKVRLADPDDALECQLVRQEAFHGAAMARCLWPRGISAETTRRAAARHRHDIEDRGSGKSRAVVLVAELMPEGWEPPRAPESGKNDSSSSSSIPGLLARGPGGLLPDGVNVVVSGGEDRSSETEKGQIVAFARWHLYRDPRPESEWAVITPTSREEVGPDCDLEVADALFGGLKRNRAKWIGGKPHILLSMLACRPEHQRLGAGTALLRWGMALADREGLECYLESTPAGYAVYQKNGFEPLAALDLDITARWGVVRAQTEDWGTANAISEAGEIPSDGGWIRWVLMKRKLPDAST